MRARARMRRRGGGCGRGGVAEQSPVDSLDEAALPGAWRRSDERHLRRHLRRLSRAAARPLRGLLRRLGPRA
eukprot:5682312-Prymnesium_polylepis.1